MMRHLQASIEKGPHAGNQLCCDVDISPDLLYPACEKLARDLIQTNSLRTTGAITRVEVVCNELTIVMGKIVRKGLCIRPADLLPNPITQEDFQREYQRLLNTLPRALHLIVVEYESRLVIYDSFADRFRALEKFADLLTTAMKTLRGT